VAAVAGIAGALSYSHMRQLADEHGQAGWHAHAFPLSVDGMDIEAAAGQAGCPGPALSIGTTGNLAANVATAGPRMTSRMISLIIGGCPP